jgi:hypothetical protein
LLSDYGIKGTLLACLEITISCSYVRFEYR